MQTLLLSVAYFLCEIGGGYLIWLWLREGYPVWYAILGAVLLVLYGIIPTFQPAHFGRTHAAYGGVFIMLALLWGWHIDDMPPNRYDVIGDVLALVGVAVIMYWPRGKRYTGETNDQSTESDAAALRIRYHAPVAQAAG